jgi:hypothetical protein
MSRDFNRPVVAWNEQDRHHGFMRARILIVEDEADMVELLRFNLQHQGYEL